MEKLCKTVLCLMAILLGSVASFAQDAPDEINGHKYVDMGLSVKWATCNVGASSPSEYGSYYAWGETSTKSGYTVRNSKTYDKNCEDIGRNSGTDVARANWGSSWRLPTKAEFDELISNCTWTWTSQDGYNGYKVTSKINGNSIFLPAAGWRSGSSSHDVASVGFYWSSTPHEDYISDAYCLSLYESSCYMMFTSRIFGQSIRPVSE